MGLRKIRIRSQFAVALAALCIFGSLMTLSSSRGLEEHSRILNRFERAKVANHGLNENILRLKTFLLLSYDPVVEDMNRLVQICNALKSADEFRLLRSPEMAPTLGAFCQDVNAKSTLLESYKTQHSILRNSIMYLPLLANNLQKTPYAHTAQMILADVLLYNMTPSEELRAKVAGELRRLPRLNPNAPQGEMLAALRLHTDSVVNHAEARRHIEEQLLSPVLSADLEKLETQYLNNYQTRQRRELIDHAVLVVVCVGMGVWLLAVFRRLNSATETLHDLNVNLESKVFSRTQELSAAMKKLADNQQLLAQSAKMTALGEMAGGIAHEINTPLAAIMLNAGFLLETVNNPDPVLIKKRVETIIRIVERVSKIISGLKRFSRSADGTNRQVVFVRTIVDDTLTLCAEKLKAHSVDVQNMVAGSDLEFECVPEHISQVVLNFLNNSLDALKENISESERWIRIEASSAGGQLEIAVTDAGLGLPDTVQARLMQPFFTTKPPGVGTGLGLSISRGIVEQHGGQLLYDRTCKNTRFVIRFPA